MDQQELATVGRVAFVVVGLPALAYLFRRWNVSRFTQKVKLWHLVVPILLALAWLFITE